MFLQKSWGNHACRLLAAWQDRWLCQQLLGSFLGHEILFDLKWVRAVWCSGYWSSNGGTNFLKPWGSQNQKGFKKCRFVWEVKVFRDFKYENSCALQPLYGPLAPTRACKMDDEVCWLSCWGTSVLVLTAWFEWGSSVELGFSCLVRNTLEIRCKVPLPPFLQAFLAYRIIVRLVLRDIILPLCVYFSMWKLAFIGNKSLILNKNESKEFLSFQEADPNLQSVLVIVFMA